VTLDQPIAQEVPQRRREHALRDLVDVFFQRAEALRTSGKLEDDQEAPFIPDAIENDPHGILRPRIPGRESTHLFALLSTAIFSQGREGPS
jgi:hypothetical protein